MGYWFRHLLGLGRRQRRVARRIGRHVGRAIRRGARRLRLGTAVVLLLGGAIAAIKLRQDDVARLEQDTGKSAENLSEEELLAAMKRLGIRKLEITDEDRAAMAEGDDLDPWR